MKRCLVYGSAYSITCLRRHSKLDKTKVLKTNGSLMKDKCIAECSLGAFCNTFDLHLAIFGLEKQLGLLFKGPLKTGFTVCLYNIGFGTFKT